ncbi:MAG: nucleotidyltransferase family protein [Synergistaceae bacterium]|jgi:predicted nucleotidyltransferase|nr:nucleotidyltransferase family protein [Synergistaceae bacterium]
MKTIDFQNPVIGIVAEYDPFHNGHTLHIARARKSLDNGRGNDAAVVIVLSSSFTQRGLPAMLDKWTRARMVLANGADLVLELPFVYACNAGPEFARGAIDTLAATGFVTHLSFGMETFYLKTTTLLADFSPENPVAVLDTIIDILIQEPLSFKSNLRKALASGMSYPKALAQALDQELPGGGAFASMPNNALALSYLLCVRRGNYGLIPLPVRREGAGYHDRASGPLASATAIRSAVAAWVPKELGHTHDYEKSWIKEAMPPVALELLKEQGGRGRLCLGTEELWILLRGLLLRFSPEELRKYAGMDEGLENLFLKHYAKANSYDDFVGRCVCARYTRNRIRRQTIRCLVGLDRWTAWNLSRLGPSYVRVLGYNERGRSLLRARASKESKNGNRTIPVVTRLAAAPGAMADLEFRASRLRELLLPCPDLRYEERHIPEHP